MSLFGINLATRALQAHQRALETVGQNIANSETPGYSRQVAVTTPLTGTGAVMFDRSGNPVAPGGGVEVVLIQRAHAGWLDRAEAVFQARSGQADIDVNFSRAVEDLLAEPTEGGLQATLDRFLAAFGTLSTRANDPAARESVVRLGEDVARRFQELTEGFVGVSADVMDRAIDNVTEINRLATQVADLNRTIARAQGAGAQPNELMDQRDQLLDQLARRAGVQVSGQETGEAIVTLGGQLLVQGEWADQLELGAGFSLTFQSTGDSVSVIGGELGAEKDWVTNILPGYRARVATVRDTFAAAVNTLHQSGNDLDGAPGEVFFLADGSGNLGVNPTLQDPRKVVAGTGAAGDGSVAQEISRLASGSASGIPVYRSFVGDLAAAGADAERVSSQMEASLRQVQGQQASESGVNLDEELANLVSLQHAYAASARMLSAFNEMLDTLINRFG